MNIVNNKDQFLEELDLPPANQVYFLFIFWYLNLRASICLKVVTEGFSFFF
jgi:hypothetical protein